MNLLPKFVKRSLFSLIRGTLSRHWQQKDAQIPKYELNKKHIQNTRFLLNRNELLKAIPTGGIIAELGVNEGDFSEMILKICEPKKLHLVDIWDGKKDFDQKRNRVEKRFSKEIETRIIKIHSGKSVESASEFPNEYFDFVYIDTDHSYETTLAELEAYLPKMKPNGIFAGHDLVIGNWIGQVKYGVIEAVYEFCVKNNWEIKYLTAENVENPSFALRKIDSENSTKP